MGRARGEGIQPISKSLIFLLANFRHQLVVAVQRANYENVEPDSQDIKWARRKAGASWGAYMQCGNSNNGLLGAVSKPGT